MLLRVLHCKARLALQPSVKCTYSGILSLSSRKLGGRVMFTIQSSTANFHDGMCRIIVKNFEICTYYILYFMYITYSLDASIYSIEIIFMLRHRVSYYPQPPSCPVSDLFGSQALPKQSTRDLALLLPRWLEVHLTTQELHGASKGESPGVFQNLYEYNIYIYMWSATNKKLTNVRN